MRTALVSEEKRIQTPDIRDIIDSGRLIVDFQQIVSVSRKMVIGVEGLIRGIDADTEERIPPRRLFDAAHRQNIALDFDRACRHTVIEAFSRLRASRREKLLFLNLDASVLDNAVGSDYLRKQISQYGINPGNVVIEISEKKVQGNAALKKFADSYRKYGFMVALDDVGSEASNIDRLLLIKPDIIKIDISLVKNIHNDFYKQGVFMSLVSMSNKIGALVIAEGVETEEEAIQILRLGGHMIQGFFFSEPQAYADETAAFTNSKIELLGRRFNEYMNLQYDEERNRNKRLYEATGKAARRLANIKAPAFDGALRDIVLKNQAMECAYILDEHGVQISSTICASDNADSRENLIFYSARKGTDHSMEKYYYPLVSARVRKHITQPYVSLATGSLCKTVSVSFAHTERSRCILCIDFKCSGAASDLELKYPIREFGEDSKKAGMMDMLSRMNEAVMKDSLTGAYNRRYIEERLLLDIFGVTDKERPISIILADIDHFKLVNDQHGHLAGDEVLRKFVQISKRCIRKNTDWIARYGGDEFLIVLLNADEKAAAAVAEEIRAAVERAVLKFDESYMSCTASFGTCTVYSKKMTCEQLIGQADKNLYTAKKAGRNCVAGSMRE